MRDAFILGAVAAWCFLVAVIGTSMGLILGTVRLPVLLLIAPNPAAGAGANIGVSAVSAAVASVEHVRAGHVNWRLVAWMTPPSIAGAIIGGYISGLLPERVLLVAIGLLLTYFGIRTLRSILRSVPKGAGEGELRIGAAVIAAVLIGLLGGLVGLILSTLRVPAMIRSVGETAQRAVGSNAVVGFFLGVAGVVGHLSAGIDWYGFIVGSLASIPGAAIGSRLTGRLSERQILTGIGIVLLIAGTTTVGRGVAA
jgi:uncharacterized protein